jgi:hypothetical protein
MKTLKVPETTIANNWAARHNKAVSHPTKTEKGIVGACYALEAMADAHAERYATVIAEDGVLGDCWLKILHGVRGMLNGETGRLDCGTIDGWLVRLALDHGFTDEEL